MALIGHRVVLGGVARLSARDPDRVVHALDALWRARLVTAEERGRNVVYEIAHPLVQQAVYEGIGPPRRTALHRQLATSSRVAMLRRRPPTSSARPTGGTQRPSTRSWQRSGRPRAWVRTGRP